MTSIITNETSGDISRRTAKKRFLFALALFFVWVLVLVVLGVLSATGPGRSPLSIEVEQTTP
ncbi:MAG: hypothetical protein ABS79_03560 [Planctomycetes bacterium SCN 63-9]|nr:MAG: hypothetical protein ABS79_03560 [Planctomycetes bacterium SCN 63-9]